MSCRLPAAVHVPLNSCHSESSAVDWACAGDAAPSPARINAAKTTDDPCRPSRRSCHAGPRRRRLTIPFRHPHQSAAKRDMHRLPMSSERDTRTEPASHLDVDQLVPDVCGPPDAPRMAERPETGPGGLAVMTRSMAALRPSGRGLLPHRGKNLAAKKLDAGQDLVLAHSRPTHAHREVVDAAAMLGDQHIEIGRAS